MYRLFIAMCFWIFPFFLFAQIDSFDIAGYARPDLRRETASVIPDFSLNTNTGTDDFLFNRKGFGFNLGGDYYQSKFINTDSTQLSSNYRLSLNISLSNFDDELNNNNTTKKYFNLSPNYSIARRHKMFKDSARFFEYDIFGNIDFDILNFDDNSNENISRELINGNISLPLYWGKGRIENVNAAWLATSILKMLDKANLLKKEIGDVEVLALADKLASFATIRNTDSRLESIARYEALCEHFMANGLVEGNDYRFFGNLNDAYLFESFISRNSGKEFKFGIIPTLSTESLSDGTNNGNFNFITNDLNSLNFVSYFPNYYYYSFYNPFYFYSPNIYTSNFSDENAQLFSGSAFFALSYSNFCPTSLNWQRDFNFQISTGPRFSKTFGELSEFEDFERTQMIANINTNYSLSFIPNQRSNYSINFNLNYLFRYNFDSTLPEQSDDFLTANVSGQYLKYVSPQVAWFIRGSLNFNIKAVGNTGFRNTNNLRVGIDYRLY